MKLLPCDENQTLPSLGGSTLVIPAVSIGNVGQLAMDLIIETSAAPRVGRFAYPSLLPCAGTGSFSHVPGAAYSMEIFSLPTNEAEPIFLVQQRGPVAPGLHQKFADDLVEWATKEAGVAKILILGSLDGRFRRDDQLTGSGLRYWSETTDLETLCTTAELRKLEEEYFEDKALEARVMPPWPLVKACKEAGVPCAAVLAFALEGDNQQDGVKVASAAMKVVPALGAGTGGAEGGKWKQPPSWKFAFGGARPYGM